VQRRKAIETALIVGFDDPTQQRCGIRGASLCMEDPRLGVAVAAQGIVQVGVRRFATGAFGLEQRVMQVTANGPDVVPVGTGVAVLDQASRADPGATGIDIAGPDLQALPEHVVDTGVADAVKLSVRGLGRIDADGFAECREAPGVAHERSQPGHRMIELGVERVDDL
jgi:hypothetical protein